MKSCAVASFLLTFVATASAHIAITWPLPFRASYNPYSDPSKIDYSITSPLSGDGSNFPCKGYQVDMGTSAGTSVVTWEAGSQYNFSTGSGALHGGGSCQIALSYDKGTSFTVIHSYIGSCPISAGQQFNFNVPSDAPTGSAMFAWVWYNEIGNREIYMDCASVTISGGSKRDTPATAFKDRPSLFVANLGNGCTTVEGKEVVYPNPGPDVTTNESVKDDSGSFTGTCQPVKGIGAGADSSSSSSSSSSNSGSGAAGSSAAASPVASTTSVAPAASSLTTTSIAATTSTAAPVATSSSTTFATVYKSTSTSSAVASASPTTGAGSTGTSSSSSPSSSGLTTTEDGQCSGAHTCEGSIHGPCCSQWGWCGSTADYCGAGCQAGFGQCGSSINSTTPAEPSSAAGSGTSPTSSSLPVSISSSASVAATPSPNASALPEPSGGVFTTAVV